MKLLRVGPVGQEKPACLDATGVIRDLTGVATDFEGEGVSLDALEALKGVDLTALPAVEGNSRIGAAVARVETFYAIGLNYAQHAAEAGMEPPK